MGGKTRTSFQPGQVANPYGRPPKNRALTEILERAGNRTLEIKGADGEDNKKVARKRLVADLAWQIITTGEATFPDGSVLHLEAKDWFDTVKWIYSHIDGPPKANLDITSNGNTITMETVVRQLEQQPSKAE